MSPDESYLGIYFKGPFQSKVVYQKCVLFTKTGNGCLMKTKKNNVKYASTTNFEDFFKNVLRLQRTSWKAVKVNVQLYFSFLFSFIIINPSPVIESHKNFESRENSCFALIYDPATSRKFLVQTRKWLTSSKIPNFQNGGESHGIHFICRVKI